jgi:hypothetical protein
MWLEGAVPPKLAFTATMPRLRRFGFISGTQTLIRPSQGGDSFYHLIVLLNQPFETTPRSNAKLVSSTPAAGHFNRERSVQLY